jgi:hypothetical protein
MAVEADVDQSQPALEPGMFVEVVWPLRRDCPSLFVPVAAVVDTAEAIFVAPVRRGKVERVPVHRGSTMGDLVEVFGSLDAGNPVVVSGSQELVDGAVTYTLFHGAKSGVMCMFRQTEGFKVPPGAHEERQHLLFYRYRGFSVCLINVGGYGSFLSVIVAQMPMDRFMSLVLAASL